MILSTATLAGGCAQRFHVIHPSKLGYDLGQDAGDSVYVAYRMNLHLLAGNRWYNRMEGSEHVKCVALRISNRSTRPVCLTPRNFGIYDAKDNEKMIVPPISYFRKIRQPFFLYLFGGVYGLEDIPIGIHANRMLLRWERANKIWNRRIQPRTVIYGLVVVNMKGNEDLSFYYNPSPPPIEHFELEGDYRPPSAFRKTEENDFEIKMKGNYTIAMKGQIRSLGCEQAVVGTYNGSNLTVRASDTKWIAMGSVPGEKKYGVAREGQWLFAVITGSIKAFNLNGTDRSIEYLQKGNGPIVPFRPEILWTMADNVDNVDALIFQQKYWKAIQRYDEQF